MSRRTRAAHRARRQSISDRDASFPAPSLEEATARLAGFVPSMFASITPAIPADARAPECPADA